MKILLYFSAVILSIFLFLNIKKNQNKILSLFIFFILIFLMANYSLINWDNQNYRYIYEKLSSGFDYDIELGYKLLNKFGIWLNLDYLGFRYLYFALFLSLLYFILMKYNYNASIFLIFYLIYPVIKDSEQLRIFSATVLLIIGCYFLILKKPKYLLFTIFCILAMSFHSSSVIFLTLLCTKLPAKFKGLFIKLSSIVVTILSLVLIINRNLFGNFFQIILTEVNIEKADRYVNSTSKFGFLLPFLLFFTNYLIFIYFNKKKNTNLQMAKNIDSNQFSYILNFMCLLSLFTLPLLLMNLHFYRIGKIICVFSLIYFGIIFKSLSINNKILLIMSLLFLYSGFLFFDFYVFGTLEKNYLPFFIKGVLNDFYYSTML